MELLEVNGWFLCSGCKKNIWRTDQTFQLEGAGVPSHHGRKEVIHSTEVFGPQDDGEAAGGAQGDQAVVSRRAAASGCL